MSTYVDRCVVVEIFESIRHAIWEIDIPSSTCPEYIEHHEQMTELIKLCDTSINSIKTMPSMEFKTGKWLSGPSTLNVCSECGKLAGDHLLKIYRYCPNCGAKMSL